MIGIQSKVMVLVFILGLVLSQTTSAQAVTRTDKAIFGFSSSAHWIVGDFSRNLSLACQRREFSQKRQFRYLIGFVGDQGRTITGIATTDWNLHDPRNLAINGMTYHFYNDGYSNCAVYVSPQPRK